MKNKAKAKIGQLKEDYCKIKLINGRLRLKKQKIKELMKLDKLKRSVINLLKESMKLRKETSLRKKKIISFKLGSYEKQCIRRKQWRE